MTPYQQKQFQDFQARIKRMRSLKSLEAQRSLFIRASHEPSVLMKLETLESKQQHYQRYLAAIGARIAEIVTGKELV